MFITVFLLTIIIICVLALTVGQKMARKERKRIMKRDYEIYKELQNEDRKV